MPFVALSLVAASCASGASNPNAASSSPTPTLSIAPTEPAPAKETELDAEYFVEVEAEDARFTPANVSMALTQVIELVNKDRVDHNITIPAASVSVDVEPGEEIYTPRVGLSPGTYAFYCRFHRSKGMRGTISMVLDKHVITLRRGY